MTPSGLQVGQVALVLLLAGVPRAGPLEAVGGQRYAMGTMFDVLVYHHSREEADRAVGRALDHITRLDRVMSHFDADSDLRALIRAGRSEATRVDPDLYEVIRASLDFSRRSGGRFDVTIGPLVKAYRAAREQARDPSAAEIAAAQACMGHHRIELVPPDRIRLHGDCLEIDLGGIGKGYAVDRALALLRDAGIHQALVNAGGSSIGAIGAPPGRAGWPVLLGEETDRRRVALLRDRALSTSQQSAASAPAGEVIDPHAGTPAPSSAAVSVFAPTATASDALATTLVMLPIGDGRRLLAQLEEVSALWLSRSGAVEASYRGPDLLPGVFRATP
jgi:FAD:protein FMN transferase